MVDRFNDYYNKGVNAGIIEWNLTSNWFSRTNASVQAFYYGIDRKTVYDQGQRRDRSRPVTYRVCFRLLQADARQVCL